MATLQHDLNVILARFTDFESIAEESVFGEDKSPAILTVEAMTSHIRRAVIGGGSAQARYQTAAYSVSVLKRLVQQSQSAVFLAPLKIMLSVELLLPVVRNLADAEELDRHAFVTILNTEVEKPPLELVWRLHCADLVTMETYITSNLSRPAHIGRIAHDVVCACQDSCRQEADEQRRKELLSGLVRFLVLQGYGDSPCQGASHDSSNPSNKGMRKVTSALLDSITKKYLAVSSDLDFCVYQGLCSPAEEADTGTVTDAGWELDAVRRFASCQLQLVLAHAPTFNVTEALSLQKKCTSSKQSRGVTVLYRQLLLPLRLGDAVGTLRRTLERHEINWCRTLGFVACLLVTKQGAPTAILDLVTTLLPDAVESGDQERLVTALLLARQASLEGPHVAPSYQEWFQSTFGRPTCCTASSRNSFTALINLLTSIVPHEDPAYLTAHISKPPWTPPKCRELLTDYVTLAKTRLLDLGMPYQERSGIFGSISGDLDPLTSGSRNTSGVTSQVERDVELAVAACEKTGRIPTSVLEASIFKKPYYLGSFVPALLTPRLLPGGGDAKTRLIELLQQADKIPGSLFSRYTTQCAQVTAQLLEGAFDDQEDVAMDAMLLSPWQQFQTTLQAIQNTISTSRHHPSSTETQLLSPISELRERIDQLLPPGEKAREPASLWQNRRLAADDTCVKIVSAIFDATVTLYSELNHVTGDRKWLGQLLSALLGGHASLIIAHTHVLLRTVDELLECDTVQESRARALGSVCAHLSSTEHARQVRVCRGGHLVLETAQLVLSRMRTGCRRGMHIALIFCHEYLLCRRGQAGGERATLLVQTQLSWLLCRFRFASHYVTSLRAQLSRVLQDDVTNCQMSLRDWLELEVKVTPGDDVIAPHLKQQYLQTTIHSHPWRASSVDTTSTPANKSPAPERAEKLSEALGSGSGGIRLGTTGCDKMARICTEIAECVIGVRARRLRECTRSCESCGESHVTDTDAPSWSHLVTLLQHCVYLLPACSPEDDPWLWNILNRDAKRGVNDPKVTNPRNKVNSVTENRFAPDPTVPNDTVENWFALDLAGLLPPYLYLVNNLSPGQPLDTTKTARFVTVTWGAARQGAFLAPEVTCYLLQGLVLAHHHCDVTQLLGQCPLLTASVQYHWDCVRPLVPDTLLTGSGGHLAEFLQRVGKISRDTRSLFASLVAHALRLSSQNDDSTVLQAFSENSAVLQASAIASQLNTARINDADATILCDLIGAREKLCSLLVSVLCSQLIPASLASAKSCTTPCATAVLLAHLFARHAPLFTARAQCDVTSRQTIMPSPLWPVSTLRCLRGAPISLTSQISGSTECMTSLLEAWRCVCRLYSQTAVETVDSVSELLDLAAYVKDCIKMAPAQTLRQISQRVVEGCDSDVRILLLQRRQ